LIPNHSIENNKQFTHTGSKDYFVGFPFFGKSLSQVAYNRVKTGGIEGGHIKRTSDVFSASKDMCFSIVFSRRAVPWSYTYQCGDFLPVKFSKFRQACDEHSRSLRTYTGGALNYTVFVFELVIGFDIFTDEFVDFVNLEIEGFNHFGDTFSDFRMHYSCQTIGFLSSQVAELMATSDKFCHFSVLRSGMRFRGRLHDFCKLRQYLRINRVGLCVLPHAFCEIPDLFGIDYNNRQRGSQQLCYDRSFITAGCFEDDQCNSLVLEIFTKLAMAIGRVWQTGFEDVWAGGNMEGVFGDVDTDIDLSQHGFFPYLQMRARSLPAAQTAVRASPTAAARFTLCGGLEGLVTIELSSPAGGGSARCARLTTTSFTYETIINHDRCQHTRSQRTQRVSNSLQDKELENLKIFLFFSDFGCR